MESLMNTDDFFFSAEDDALAEKIAAFFPKKQSDSRCRVYSKCRNRQY